MYLNQNTRKQSDRCFKYDLSGGIENSYAGKMGKIIAALNVSSKQNPMITSMGKLYRMSYPNDAICVGSYGENIYYNTRDSFYFNGVKKGNISFGEKVFVNFANRVYIFPDRIYYDLNTDTYEYFYRAVTAQLRIYKNDGQYEAQYSDSREGNLAEYFSESKSIKVTGSRDGVFDGCFKINGFDKEKGIVKFGHCEPDEDFLSTVVATISNGAPELLGAIACKNRVWGFIGNKIYASALGDGLSWCDFDDENGSYFYENLGGDTFSAINSIEDQPVLFTHDNVYKIYGDNVIEYSLKMLSGHGGIEDGFYRCHARIFGDVYYINKNSIIKLSGARGDVICRLNDNDINAGFCCGYGDKLYFSYYAQNGEHLCVLDASFGIIYEIGIRGVKGFLNLYGGICAITDNEIISLDGKIADLPSDFVADTDITSYIEFNEIHNDWDRFSPAKLYLRSKILPDGELNIYCMLGNSGEWSFVHTVKEEGERLWEFSLPASLTDSFRLKIEGRGDYTLNNIYVLFS